jgi:hypothetical protein
MSDIFKINSSILSGINLPEPLAKAEPAKSPGMKGTGFTSFGECKKAPESEVLPEAIPIFPMRYVQKWDVFSKQLKESYIPEIPTSLDSAKDYELARIRQGYIYLFFQREGDSNPIWHIYKYVTEAMDENAGLMAEELDFVPAVPNSFVKFEWQSGKKTNWSGVEITSDNEIKYPESFPYPFVPNDVEECWVAYSEYRWPELFFYSAQKDAEFRESLMLYVDVKCQSAPHVAPLKNIHNYCPYIYSGLRDDWSEEAVTEQVKNQYRYTHLVSEQLESLVRNPNALDHGVMVALFDPIGDQLDFNRLINCACEEFDQFYLSRQHAYETGLLVDEWVKAGKVDYSFLKFDVVDSDFSNVFGKIKKEVKEREENLKRLADDWLEYKNRPSDLGLNNYIMKLENSLDRYSDIDYEQELSLVKFYLHEMSKPSFLLGNNRFGKKLINEAFKKNFNVFEEECDSFNEDCDVKVENEAKFDEGLLQVEADRIFRSVKILEQLSNPENAKKAHKAIDEKAISKVSNLVFGFYFHIYAEPFSEVIGYMYNKPDRRYSFEAVFRRFFDYEKSVSIGSKDEAVRFFSKEFSKNSSVITAEQIINQTDARAVANSSVENKPTPSELKLKRVEQFKKIDAVRFQVKFEFSVSRASSVASEAKNLDIYNFAEAGFGALGGLVTCYIAFKNWHDLEETASSYDSRLMKLGLSPPGQLIGAWLDVYAALFAIQENSKFKIVKERMFNLGFKTPVFQELYRRIANRVSNALFNYGTEMYFKKNPLLINRVVSVSLSRVVSFSAMVFTAFLAFVAAVDNYKNNEKTSMIGNMLWFVGTPIGYVAYSTKMLKNYVALARVLKPLSILIIITGLIMTMITRNKFEKIVDKSLWGTEKKDLMGDDRFKMKTLEIRTHATIKGYMKPEFISYKEKDLANFYDMLYGLIVTNENISDGCIEVFEGLASLEYDVDKLIVESSIEYERNLSLLNPLEMDVEPYNIRVNPKITKVLLSDYDGYEVIRLNFNDNKIFKPEMDSDDSPAYLHVTVSFKSSVSTFSDSMTFRLGMV